MDVEKLLLNINSGKDLCQKEVDEVAAFLEAIHTDERLSSRLSLDDIYELILVLGRARARQYRHLIERYLESKDPTTVTLVLEILCLHWKEHESYLERLINFSLGVVWDTEGDVRIAALQLLGEYLRARIYTKREADLPRLEIPENERNQVCHVIDLLLQLFDDADEDYAIRHAAYAAMLAGAGVNRDALPTECCRLNFDHSDEAVKWNLVQELRILSNNLVTS